MNDSFPGANVTQYKSYISSITLPDKDDRHVVAAAIKEKADAIVTFNLRDFPSSALSSFGIEAVHPDRFALNLIDLDENAALKGFRKMAARLKKPPLSNDDVLSALKKAGIRKGSKKLQKLLD